MYIALRLSLTFTFIKIFDLRLQKPFAFMQIQTLKAQLIFLCYCNLVACEQSPTPFGPFKHILKISILKTLVHALDLLHLITSNI